MARANSVQYLLGTKFYKMAYVEFGNPAAPAVLCVHGLTRNGRDFDMLAAALEDRFHVICPDLPGRGKSDWLAEPMAYQPPSYVVALSHLLAALGKPVSWVGTSLGGICGMMVAAAQNTPIKRMVLNDVGPLIPAASLKRIRDYMVGAPERFANMATLEAHLREVHAPFGKLTDAQWAHMARYSARSVLDQTGAGTLAMHFDPKIIEPMRGTVPLDVDLWPLWEMIKMPLLTIRGEQSDLLLPETFERMLKDGAKGYIVPDTGHAPALMDAVSIAAVRAFLLGAEGSGFMSVA
ncbi:MAG TPA: alpha/beta hydrolase [Acidocella sp.]|nr:alpha/beta hydrolase [Acidocella sp.]